ncbi:MAG: hypothetical protein LIP12_12325 [Clostridiales bacterium]|nr:hypothetical protein [Clostridiales bacterium]
MARNFLRNAEKFSARMIGQFFSKIFTLAVFCFSKFKAGILGQSSPKRLISWLVISHAVVYNVTRRNLRRLRQKISNVNEQRSCEYETLIILSGADFLCNFRLPVQRPVSGKLQIREGIRGRIYEKEKIGFIIGGCAGHLRNASGSGGGGHRAGRSADRT